VLVICFVQESFSSLGKGGIRQIYGMRKSDTIIGGYGSELVKVR